MRQGIASELDFPDDNLDVACPEVRGRADPRLFDVVVGDRPSSHSQSRDRQAEGLLARKRHLVSACPIGSSIRSSP